MRYGVGCNLGVSVYLEALEAMGFEVHADDGNHVVRPYNWDADENLPKRAGPILVRRADDRRPSVADASLEHPRKNHFVGPTLPEVWRQVVEEMTEAERTAASDAINARVSALLARVQSMTTLLGYVYHADV